jgi:hypothetical protein
VDSRAQSAATVGAELRSIAAVVDARAEREEAAFQVPRRVEQRRTGVGASTWMLIAAVGALAIWLWRAQPWRWLR